MGRRRREAGGGGGGGTLFRKIERGGGGGGEGPPPASQQALNKSTFFRTGTRYFGSVWHLAICFGKLKKFPKKITDIGLLLDPKVKKSRKKFAYGAFL